jgi:hypothetical protein
MFPLPLPLGRRFPLFPLPLGRFPLFPLGFFHSPSLVPCANKAQEMHKTQETHINNREGKSHRVEKQSMGLLCFFHRNQTNCFVWFL